MNLAKSSQGNLLVAVIARLLIRLQKGINCAVSSYLVSEYVDLLSLLNYLPMSSDDFQRLQALEFSNPYLLHLAQQVDISLGSETWPHEPREIELFLK